MPPQSGLLIPGNVDLPKQPRVKNTVTGGESTVFSRSYNIDGKEYLLPSVTPDGRFLATDDEVVNEFKKTGRHLGAFRDANSATAYGQKLHQDYESGRIPSMPQKAVDLSQYDLDASGNPIKAPVDLSKYDLDASGTPIIQSKPKSSIPPQQVSQDEPGTFWGGVGKSLTSGEAIGAGARGALGYAQGAIADLPSSIYGGLSSVANALINPSPQVITDLKNSITALPGHVSDVYSHAGSDPQAFGEMMGQFTGQPAVTAGLMKGAPYAKAAAKTYGPRAAVVAGPAVEGIGRFIKKEGLASGVLPPIATPRYLRHGEQLLGRGIEALGQRMRIPTVEGEVVPPPTPPRAPFQEGQVIPPDYPQLPPSPTSFYGEPPPTPSPVNMDDLGTPIQPKQLTAGTPPARFTYREAQPTPVNMDDLGRPIPPKQLGPASTTFNLPENLNPPTMENLGTSTPTPPTQSPLITIKGGPTGELQVAKAQAQGYKLVGLKNGDYIMEAATESAPQATPVKQTTEPSVATPNAPPTPPTVKTKVAPPRRASSRMGSPALNLPNAPAGFVQKVKNFINDTSGHIDFGEPVGPPNMGDRPASQMDRLRSTPSVVPEEPGIPYGDSPEGIVQPDITPGQESVPQTGGTSPTFTPQTPGELPSAPPSFMDKVRQFINDESGTIDFGDGPIVGEQGPQSLTSNASGESMASQEAINRQTSMKAQGRQFGVYDRAGNFRPLIGPEAVDYNPSKGETYGVHTKNGFQTLEDNGGRVPQTGQTTAPTTPSQEPNTYDLGELVGPETDPIALDTARLKHEYETRPFSQERADDIKDWNNRQKRMNIYEGRNDNIHTPLDRRQLLVKAANDKIEEFSRKHSEWFHEQESKLPEDEFFKEPPESKAKFDAEYARLQDERNALAERLYPEELKKVAPRKKDIEIAPPSALVKHRGKS